MKEISYKQKSAMLIAREFADTIITNNSIASVFLEKIKTISDSVKYADIVKEVLCTHPKIHEVSMKTLRSSAQIALKELLTQEERNKIITQSLQRGGRNSILNLQKKKKLQAISEEEKKVLEYIGNNPEGYKKSSVRDITRIQATLKQETGEERKKGTIKAYMRKFTTTTKECISWETDPEEINTLKELYQKYYVEGKKLPIQKIMKIVNDKHHHNRNENAIENYIRTHWKTAEEKEKMRSEIWSEEETLFIKDILAHKDEYKIVAGRGVGGYNLRKIEAEFQKRFPEKKRNAKGIKHQITRQEKEENIDSVSKNLPERIQKNRSRGEKLSRNGQMKSFMLEGKKYIIIVGENKENNISDMPDDIKAWYGAVLEGYKTISEHIYKSYLPDKPPYEIRYPKALAYKHADNKDLLIIEWVDNLVSLEDINYNKVKVPEKHIEPINIFLDDWSYAIETLSIKSGIRKYSKSRSKYRQFVVEMPYGNVVVNDDFGLRTNNNGAEEQLLKNGGYILGEGPDEKPILYLTDTLVASEMKPNI